VQLKVVLGVGFLSDKMVDYIWEALVYNWTLIMRFEVAPFVRDAQVGRKNGTQGLGQQLRTRVGVVNETKTLHNHVMRHRLSQSMRIEACVEKYRVKVDKVVRKQKSS